MISIVHITHKITKIKHPSQKKFLVELFISDRKARIGRADLSIKGRGAAICRLWVSAKYRGVGNGAWLLCICQEVAEQNNAEFLGLLVKRYNAKVESFYHKCGYRTVYQYDDGDLLLSIPIVPRKKKK